MTVEHFDVLIVGAGLSGIDAAWHLNRNCQNKRYAILEGREDLGGTWDLFRYPGIRSDSDMFTLGYGFKPWEGRKAVADGADIKAYIKETAVENGIREQIRFNHRVKSADWSSGDARWTVKADIGDNRKKRRFTCNFLMMCSGYFRYDRGYTPEFKGFENFKGRTIHPQHWPEDLDYNGKKVVVIGSGATAMTLVPAVAKKAGHVTLLQRSPTYVISLPDTDVIADLMRKFLPSKLAYSMTRMKNVALSMFLYELSRRRPELVKKALRAQLKRLLPADFDLDTHFKPHYNPWDQRLCLVANADLFTAIRNGTASVVTDHVDYFTETGIRLTSGQELVADIIVTATGLDLVNLGGAQLTVDGRRIKANAHYSYKAMMLDDVPNMISVIGYSNASWTLRADLICAYAIRLINYMDKHGYDYAMPRHNVAEPKDAPILELTSGYVQRAIDRFPKQGAKAPWRVYPNYVLDLLEMRYAPIKDNAMRFYRAGGAGAAVSMAD